MAMGPNQWLYFEADEHSFATYFDVYQGYRCGSKLNERRGYACFGACLHLPGFHFGYRSFEPQRSAGCQQWRVPLGTWTIILRIPDHLPSVPLPSQAHRFGRPSFTIYLTNNRRATICQRRSLEGTPAQTRLKQLAEGCCHVGTQGTCLPGNISNKKAPLAHKSYNSGDALFAALAVGSGNMFVKVYIGLAVAFLHTPCTNEPKRPADLHTPLPKMGIYPV